MEYSTKRKENASVLITVKHSPKEVEQAYQSAYEKARGQIKLPGFRKGKVPLELVEEHLGDSIANDAARGLIADTFQNIVEKLDPPPISIPSFEVESFDRDKGALYKGTYDTYPTVKIGKYKKVKSILDTVKISENIVAKELERLQKEHAVSKSRENEPVQKGDLATLEIDIKEKAKSKSIFKSKDFQYMPGENRHLPGLDEHILGMMVGEKKEFELSIEEEFVDKTYAGKNLEISAHLTSARYPEYPEINDDFAKDLGEYENLDQLKSKILNELKERADSELKSRCLEDIIKKIIADSKLEMPDSLVESEFKRRLDNIKNRIGNKDLDLEGIAVMTGQNKEKLENDLKEISAKAVQDRLVLEEIAKREKLQVDKQEVEAEFRARFSQIIPEERMEQFLEREEIQDDIKGKVLYKKCLDWIFEHSEIKQGSEIPFEKLQETE